MAGKNAKAKTKGPFPQPDAAAAQVTEPTSKQAPVKKKQKNHPLRPQPAWLFPPDEENPILNPKTKSKEEIQKEIDERLAAIKFLEHKSVTAPVKTAPPSELLQLIGAFLASYGFISTGRIFTTERNARRKLEGWNDAIGEKKFPKGMPDLVKIFKDWRADWDGNSDDETSSSDDDVSDEDVKNEDAGSESNSSGSDGDSDEDEEVPKVKQAVPTMNGVKIKAQLTESGSKKVAKGTKPVASVSTADSESDSDSDEENGGEANSANDKKGSSSSSGSSTDSNSEEDRQPTINKSLTNKSSAKPDLVSQVEARAKKFLNDVKKSVLPSSIAIKAGSDSSETLKGNSPTKQLSPSVSSSSKQSSSASSSASESSSSESDSADEPAAKPANSTTSALTPSKRKGFPGLARDSSTDDPSAASSKRMKTSNEPFSRIPKDTKVDPRLSSNKYVPYDYADRAHQDLIVTKGKGFTKEKNKKKRGSYRGGKIDTDGGKAIKFED